MRKLTFLIAFFMASICMAAVDLSIGPPTSPILIESGFSYTDANGNTVNIQGPWFALQFAVANNTLATITLEAFKVEFAERSLQQPLQRSIVLAPGESYSSPTFYIGDVPAFTGIGDAGLSIGGYVGANTTTVTLTAAHFTIDNTNAP